ncbi:MAG TPA: ATP-binding protein [Bryobacteraceae bacterium]|nr:ATP-binding protein [Bryobacteraceae bacterium]
MSLRIQLTLWSVLVTSLIVGVVSVVDLVQEVKHQFDATLERARFSKDQATNLVQGKANRDLTVSVQEALRRDKELPRELLNLMTATNSLFEIAVCDPQGVILSDSDPTQVGKKFPSYPDFERLVKTTSLIHKTRVLLINSTDKYQLSEWLGAANKPQIYVSVVVWPNLIRKDMIPTIQSHAELSALLFAGAMVAAILFSAIAFRPIGKLGHMLDLLMKGEYQNPETLPAAKSRPDEFAVVASKVNLLGQQLRGAKYDFSDLRGNFERLLDDLEDAILVFGRDRRLVAAAGAVEKFLGRERSDLIGRPLLDIFPPSTSLGLLLQQAAQTGRSIHNRRIPLEAGGNGSSGVAVALLSVDVLEALQSSAVTGAGAGILVRLRDPEATRQISRQLQIADRVSAISRITGGVAHEVKNPLNAILMHVELARMKLAGGDSDLKPQMDIIGSEIVRLDRVVKTFLDFTRPVELHPIDVPLESFVNEIAEFARPLAETAGIEVTVEQQANGASIAADLDLLKQAILNVVMNAIEAMPDGGQLRFQSSLRGDDAEIRISDTGCGIPSEARKKIFGLYFTTKPKGSGIGLAMAFRFVQLHDGTIEFTSEPGKGTTFIIRIPTAVSTST